MPNLCFSVNVKTHCRCVQLKFTVRHWFFSFQIHPKGILEIVSGLFLFFLWILCVLIFLSMLFGETLLIFEISKIRFDAYANCSRGLIYRKGEKTKLRANYVVVILVVTKIFWCGCCCCCCCYCYC